MPGIFDDEQADPGQIRSNPFGTRPILPLAVVVKYLKWPVLRRISRLVRDKMCHAGTKDKWSPQPKLCPKCVSCET